MYVFVLESCVFWVFGMNSRVFHGDQFLIFLGFCGEIILTLELLKLCR